MIMFAAMCSRSERVSSNVLVVWRKWPKQTFLVLLVEYTDLGTMRGAPTDTDARGGESLNCVS